MASIVKGYIRSSQKQRESISRQQDFDVSLYVPFLNVTEAKIVAGGEGTSNETVTMITNIHLLLFLSIYLSIQFFLTLFVSIAIAIKNLDRMVQKVGVFERDSLPIKDLPYGIYFTPLRVDFMILIKPVHHRNNSVQVQMSSNG
jgi:hypothetical protein